MKASFILALLLALMLLASSTAALAVEVETPEADQPTEVTAASAQLNGTLNPGKAGAPGPYFFQYAASGTSCGGDSRDTPELNDAGGKQEHVQALVANLNPGTTYTFCLYVRNPETGEAVAGPALSFTTLVTNAAVSEPTVTITGPSTATAYAEISPGGLSTGYHAEYVSEAQFEVTGWGEASQVPASDAELPASGTPISVSQELSGLQPGLVYHLRFTATNALGAVHGGEEVFTTATSLSGGALPDSRAYELVSTEGTGEPYYPLTTAEVPPALQTSLPFEAAADGESVAYAAEPPASGGSGEVGDGEGNQWLATRTSSGWKGEDITPPSTTSTVYQAFSMNLTTTVLQGGSQSLTPDVSAGCDALYTRSTATGAFNSVVGGGEHPTGCGRPLFAGASEDESQVIFQSEAALTNGAQPASEVPARHEGRHQAVEEKGEPCMYGCNLYDLREGTLQLVNVLPGPEARTVPNATFGGYPTAGEEHEGTDFSNVISTDGSRIFWTDTQEGPDMEHVYVLEDGSEEVQVSGAAPAQYWTATPDGHYAFYTEAGELWRFDSHTNTRERLTSAGAGVLGVIGTNQTGEDGAYLYFVATGVLASNEDEAGETATAGEPNLYLWHADASHFVSTLSWQDGPNPKSHEHLQGVEVGGREHAGDWTPNLGERLASVTPDGEHLIFESVRPLTGYDNQIGGGPATEAFVYSAGDARLACVSCGPAGAVARVAESLATKLPVSSNSNVYVRRWISEDGRRVVFDSNQALVPQDTNGVADVYEWESEEEGTCAEGSATRLNRGCVFLLSGGYGKDPSVLVDADATGSNVFFDHVGPLGQVDVPEGQAELYDARVGGGFSHSSTGCVGTGCQGVPPAPPIFATPASVTFSGVGNFPPVVSHKKPIPKSLTRAQKLARALKTCGKDKSKRARASCQTRAQRSYGPKPKTKRTANNKRGAKS